MTLLEVMIAILIFSFGILGLMGLQAASISNSSASRYRTEASFLANQLIGELWANRATVEANKTLFAHHPTGGTGAALCAPSGNAAQNLVVINWLNDVAKLPGATAARQQVRIANDMMVTITICWQPPGETGFRNHIEVAQLVGSPI
jgi:type IV pilus assembly protein PilV